MLTANLPVTRPPNRRRVARQPTIIEGRFMEPQVKPPKPPRHPSVTRLIFVAVAVGVVALVGFAMLWLVAGAR